MRNPLLEQLNRDASIKYALPTMPDLFVLVYLKENGTEDEYIFFKKAIELL